MATKFHFNRLLDHSWVYHYARQVLTLGLPLQRWGNLAGLTEQNERIVDIGCGPADILRGVSTRQAAFYLGIDSSPEYLQVAERRANKLGMSAKFICFDLNRLGTEESNRQQFREILISNKITSALLFGVLHHLSDSAAQATLDLLHSVPLIRKVVTQDVLLANGAPVNNWFCRRDRGEFVRYETGYDKLIQQTKWGQGEKARSHPGLWAIQYLHYTLKK